MSTDLSIRSLCSLAAVAAACSFLSQAALAAPVPISPITATSSSEFGGAAGRAASDTVGGFNFTTGLSEGIGPVDPVTGLVFPQQNGDASDMWMTDALDPEIADITFNLGGNFNLDRVWIWNSNEIHTHTVRFNRGAATTGTVETSLDDITWTPLLSASDVPLTRAPGTAGYDTPDVVLLGGTSANYIRFTNLTSFPDGEAFVGLSDVIFFEDAVIPEPSTLLLAVLGLLGIAASGLRRRRRR